MYNFEVDRPWPFGLKGLATRLKRVTFPVRFPPHPAAMVDSRKLEACIAYSLRHAKQAGWEEVADFLCGAFFHARHGRKHRHPVGLYSVLGLDMKLHDSSSDPVWPQIRGSKIDNHSSAHLLSGTSVNSSAQIDC